MTDCLVALDIAQLPPYLDLESCKAAPATADRVPKDAKGAECNQQPRRVRQVGEASSYPRQAARAAREEQYVREDPTFVHIHLEGPTDIFLPQSKLKKPRDPSSTPT